MEVEKSNKRSCFTQTFFLGEDLGEDSQLEYLSAHEEYEEDKNNWSEFSEQGEVGEVKDVPQIGDKAPPQIAAREEESGKDKRPPAHSMAVEPDIPFLPLREKAQLCKRAEPSSFSSCEKPAVCTHGSSSADSPAVGAETQFPVPEILPGKNPVAGMGAADKSSGGSSSAVKLESGEALRSVLCVSVDAGSDSRAAFPMSRSSSAQVCFCSKAVNTEVTMMNKTGPMGWLGETSVDAASNTEWSFRAQGSHRQESKGHLCICDWKTGTNRPEHPNKQTGKNSAPGCCQKVLQRAAEAELQLLAIHYEMCYQHCLKVYELALESIPYFGRFEGKTELYSSLLLVLDELDKNYSKMRMEINKGIPLNELPPLSVELKFSPISSFYVPSKVFRKSLPSDDLSGEEKADFQEPKPQEKGISLNMDKLQTDGDQPGDSASPETGEEQPAHQALERGCVKNAEGSEYWFDAKEDLSVTDTSIMCKEIKKQRGKQDSVDSREVKTMGSGDERSSVHGGGLKPSVPEKEFLASLRLLSCSTFTTKCPALKSPTQDLAHSLLGDNQKDLGENSLQKTSTSSSLNQTGVFVSPYALNLSSFTKLIKRLQEKHPELSRDEIVEAVQEVRKINKGVLNGLAISSIEEKASAILRRWTRSSRQEKR